MATELIPLPAVDGDVYPRVQLSFVSGDTVYFSVLVEDPDPDSVDPENPDMIPRILTGWSGRAQIRKSSKKNADLFSTFLVTGFGTDGVVNCKLTPTESDKARKPGGWDLELTDPSGDVETILGGPFVPQEDYTQ